MKINWPLVLSVLAIVGSLIFFIVVMSKQKLLKPASSIAYKVFVKTQIDRIKLAIFFWIAGIVIPILVTYLLGL